MVAWSWSRSTRAGGAREPCSCRGDFAGSVTNFTWSQAEAHVVLDPCRGSRRRRSPRSSILPFLSVIKLVDVADLLVGGVVDVETDELGAAPLVGLLHSCGAAAPATAIGRCRLRAGRARRRVRLRQRRRREQRRGHQAPQRTVSSSSWTSPECCSWVAGVATLSECNAERRALVRSRARIVLRRIRAGTFAGCRWFLHNASQRGRDACRDLRRSAAAVPSRPAASVRSRSGTRSTLVMR